MLAQTVEPKTLARVLPKIEVFGPSIYRRGRFRGVWLVSGTWVRSRVNHRRGWPALVRGKKWEKKSEGVGSGVLDHV